MGMGMGVRIRGTRMINRGVCRMGIIRTRSMIRLEGKAKGKGKGKVIKAKPHVIK